MHSHSSPSAHWSRVVPLALLLPGLAAACSASSANTPREPTLFGGTGAQVGAPKSSPLSDAPAETDSDPCAAGAPVVDRTLIDDFEDGDHKIFKAFQREGWLYVAADDSPGQVSPPVGELRPERLAAEGGSPDQLFALHGSASSFTAWGVVWGTTLRWVGEGNKCPLNVSNFAGIRFRARGKGSLSVRLGTWDTVPTEFDGKCKNRCWDTHSKRVFFSDDWQVNVVLWDQLQQFGWGTQARFDPKHVLNINFSADAKDLPVDFWIDDLEFISAEQAANPHIQPTHDAPAPASTGPAGTSPAPSSPAPSSPAASSTATPASPSASSVKPQAPSPKP